MKASMKAGRKTGSRTERDIKHALLRLLQDKPLESITMSALAAEAGVSRSTLYQHYGNVAEAYERAAEDLMTQFAPALSQVSCTSDGAPGPTEAPDACGTCSASSSTCDRRAPFCSMLREPGPYYALMRDRRFMESTLSAPRQIESHDLFDVFRDAGYSAAQARALCVFQLNGCYAAARSPLVPDSEWPAAKKAIDRFIQGGIAACLAAKEFEKGQR